MRTPEASILSSSGHDHLYERFAPQSATGALDPVHGVRQFVVGTGGWSHGQVSHIQPNSETRAVGLYGVLKLTLHPPNQLQLDVRAGAARDLHRLRLDGLPLAPQRVR